MAVTRVAVMMSAVPMMRMTLVDTMMAAVELVPLNVFDEATRGSGLVDSWNDW